MNIKLFLEELDEFIKSIDNSETRVVLEEFRELILKTPVSMLREQLIMIRDKLAMEG